MSWLQLDDRFAEHPKIEALTDHEFRVHIKGLLYCSRHLTDGYIPKKTAHSLVPRADKTCPNLVLKGVWKIHENGYEIHDYLDWNKSRADVENQRKANQEAGRLGAQTRWHQTRIPMAAANGKRHSPPLPYLKEGLDLGVKRDCDEPRSPLEAARLVKSVNGHLAPPQLAIRRPKCSHEMQQQGDVWKCNLCGLEQID